MGRRRFNFKNISKAVMLLSLLSGQGAAAEQALPQTLTMAATEWCPYTCGDEGSTTSTDRHPGIVVEYIQWLLHKQGIRLKVEILPWSRAVSEAEAGLVDGLLTAVRGEVNSLLLTSQPTMSYQSCFFVDTDNAWQYQGVSSLAGMHLAAIAGYGYGSEVDGYLLQHAGSEDVVTLVRGRNGLQRLPMMVKGGRIDAYIADKNVEAWRNLSSGGVMPVNNAGCIPAEPFYLALTPHRAWADTLLEHLNQSLQQADNQQQLKRIIDQYR
ncbi:MAG: hypothetical protein CMI02_14815 [Oceanospirillaceae bacterium]|nr:hypothetical protein [Oceanospirillaceae bacterium]MBT13295.1 hypothetical protein [Oceanospirillaceae bacterium]|tara:strand:+ start:27977 stop:28780 length:804 start_codon:yes stop_codon:yes gene_type:complete